MLGDPARVTGRDNWFEDFRPGDVFEHFRGKTVGEIENVTITHMAMNTAQSHFNEDAMSRTEVGQRVVFGGVTIAIAIGLAMQDTGENAVAELGMSKVRLKAPVFHGDTLYAFSRVEHTAPGPDSHSGEVLFRHWAINQAGAMVFEAERRVLLRRRGAWSRAHAAAGATR
jgi:acyl dehydratase